MKSAQKRSNGRRRVRPTLSLVLFALLLASLLGRAEQTLGELTFSKVPAMTLDGPHLGRGKPKVASIEEAVGSFMFVSSVGGVAFGGTATPNPGFKVVSLGYSATRPDGQRLEVTLNGPAGKEQKVVANIPDWQLVPIARFAESETFACFTLFGELQDKSKKAELEAEGAKILNYHSAFENTLLGLRLLHADILILYPDSAELIADGGHPILGTGEKAPDVAANKERLDRVQSYMNKLEGGPFQSYVICDVGQEVRYGATNSTLELTGWPVWHCWRSKLHGAANSSVQKAANRYANEQMNRDPVALAEMSKEEQEARFNKLWDEYTSPRLLQQMPEYSAKLSDKIRAVDGVNPAVYDSLVATMRYAAFFRHVRKSQPEAWRTFMRSLPPLRATPAVQTPTVMRLPADLR